ncbi:putative ribonuclease H-like domain-containing protein [Tanacetum coccineum]
MIEATHDELLQFKLQKVWTLVDLPYGKRAIGTKWMYRNKKDDRVARIEVIRLFLAYASFMNFTVYQMDVNSAFLYGTIEEEVYVCQPSGFEDPEFPNKVYKVEKALYGLHQAPKAWYKTLSTYLLENGFRRGTIDKTLLSEGKDRFAVKQKDDGIFISQDKYVADILKKFDFATVKTASTPMETNKALLKDEEAADVDGRCIQIIDWIIDLYLTASQYLDIMHPKLGLWYPSDSPFDLEAFSNSDYAGASLDRKSTTGGYLEWNGTTAKDEFQVSAVRVTYYWQIQALVDKKKAIITEKSVRSNLMLEDAEGIECLPNDEDDPTGVGKIADLDADEEVTLIDETQEIYDEEMLFDVQDNLQVLNVVTTASATTTVDELTLAQTLIEIKAAKPKAVTTSATIITTAVASTSGTS